MVFAPPTGGSSSRSHVSGPSTLDSVLERGYTITHDGDGNVLRTGAASLGGATAGPLVTEFADGMVTSRVERVEERGTASENEPADGSEQEEHP